MASNNDRVAIYTINSYEDNLQTRVFDALNESGFIHLLRTSPARVLVKPNLIHAAAPEKAQTTHPLLVESVVRILMDAGHEVTLADSYSGARLWNEGGLRTVYRKTGMADVAKRTGCSLNWDTGWTVRNIQTSSLLARVEILNIVDEVDWIVNLPKLKTHVYTGFSVAVKNMFGLVPGHFKVSYHARFADVRSFAVALRDIALSLPVRFTIVDGILAMEGNGPTGGSPRQTGVVFMGDNLLAVDTAAARICGYDPSTVQWLPDSPATFTGPEPESLMSEPLRKPDIHRQGMGVFSNRYLRKMAQGMVRDLFAPVPVPDDVHCVRCGLCVQACPAEAVVRSDTDSVPSIQKERCIRCYCCHEACQHHAVNITPSRIARWLT